MEPVDHGSVFGLRRGRGTSPGVEGGAAVEAEQVNGLEDGPAVDDENDVDKDWDREPGRGARYRLIMSAVNDS